LETQGKARPKSPIAGKLSNAALGAREDENIAVVVVVGLVFARGLLEDRKKDVPGGFTGGVVGTTGGRLFTIL
jgi:hypothetical protein